MLIDMLMVSGDSHMWATFSTFALHVSAPSKPRMLPVTTLQGLLINPIKVCQLISPSLALNRRILSFDSPLAPKSRRNSATRHSRERLYGTQRIQLSVILMQMVLERQLNHGALNMKTRNKKIAMNAKWNELLMTTCRFLILTSTEMTIALASMERLHGSSSLTTFPG